MQHKPVQIQELSEFGLVHLLARKNLPSTTEVLHNPERISAFSINDLLEEAQFTMPSTEYPLNIHYFISHKERKIMGKMYHHKIPTIVFVIEDAERRLILVSKYNAQPEEVIEAVEEGVVGYFGFDTTLCEMPQGLSPYQP